MEHVARPTTRERAAALLASGMLAAAMGAGALMAPPQALAYDTGSITIEVKDNAHAAKYNIYQIFEADIAPDATSAEYPGIATHVQWNDAAKAATLAFLDANGYPAWLASNGHTGAGAHDLPQNAAEFIAQKIGASPNDAQAATTPPTKAAESFALELARALDSAFRAGGAAIYHAETSAAAPGKATFSGTEGYYLFVTADNSLSEGEAGTAPIWVPLGGATETIVEKTSAPTLKKEVKDDSDGAWAAAADANRDQDLDFRLTATMPKNIGSFDAYLLQFEDTLPAGLALAGGNTSSVQVKVGATDITADLAGAKGSITSTGGKLTVHIADVKTVHTGLAIDADSVVTVEYKAHPTASAAIGPAGNGNSAVLRYTDNPATYTGGAADSDAGVGKTTPGTATIYAYQLELTKVDKQTHEPLSGAQFKVQVANANTDEASRGKWLKADGSLAAAESQAATFSTDASGKLTIPHLDEGVYTLKEAKAPEGYEVQDADIALTISRSFRDGALVEVSAQVSGGEATKTLDADVVTGVEVEKAGGVPTGKVLLTTSDDKQVSMPITGMDGVTAGLVYGTGAVALGLAGWHATRRRAEGPEE